MKYKVGDCVRCITLNDYIDPPCNITTGFGWELGGKLEIGL